MKKSLFATITLLVSIFNTSPAVARNYHFSTTGMPDQAIVKIFGNEYPGGDFVGGCPQYDTYFEAATVTNEDVLVTVGGGYVYIVNIDNDNCELSIEFKHCFLPTTAAEAGVQYEYMMKTPQEYLMVSPDGIELSQKKKDADRIIFIEDFENPGRYYIYDQDAKCYITYSTACDGNSFEATERGKYLRELTSPVNTWRFFLLEDRKSVAVVPSSWGSASENSQAWAIKPYTTGSLACATTLFSLPGNEFIHKIIPEEGMEVIDVDFGSLTTLELCEDRLTVGNRYRYVKGSAPAEEGTYSYTVKLKDADGSIENVPVKLTVSSYLQSPTPAMGWLSWNWFERAISHKKICKLVKGMEKRGLIDAGYNTIILDDTWATNQSDQSKLTYDPVKFPKGISGLVKDCKSINPAMRLGIYSDAGLMTCAGYQPGSYGYENQHINLFDSWGVDLLKYDFCNSQASAYDSYSAMGKAISALNERRKSEGRNPFVYYICEWGHFYPYLWAPEAGGSMWRASGDSRESWIGHHNRLGVLAIVDEARHMWMWAGVNRFNDLDMTLIGLHGLGCPSNNSAEHLENSGVIPSLTDEQYRTNMALWCMLASPIFHSCDFRMKPRAEGNTTAGVLPSPLLTKEDIATVSNKYLISIDQDPLGQQAEYFEYLSTGTTDYSSKGYDVYVKDLAGGRMAVSVTNRASTAQESVTLPLKELYLDGTAEYLLLDVWTGSTTEVRGSLVTGPIDPYQTKVYIISK